LPFTSLFSISGENIKVISTYAFSGCTNLESVSLPLADSIGWGEASIMDDWWDTDINANIALSVVYQ
jgi:hypothetical protein